MSQQHIWLLLEDESSLRAALEEMLDVWEVIPLVFASGEEAMEWLDQVEAGQMAAATIPELALIDVRLPGDIQGHDVAGRMRRTKRTANCKLVMISAFRFTPDEREEIETLARPDMFVNKPFPDLFEFKAALDSLIDRSG